MGGFPCGGQESLERSPEIGKKTQKAVSRSRDGPEQDERRRTQMARGAPMGEFKNSCICSPLPEEVPDVDCLGYCMFASLQTAPCASRDLVALLAASFAVLVPTRLRSENPLIWRIWGVHIPERHVQDASPSLEPAN